MIDAGTRRFAVAAPSRLASRARGEERVASTGTRLTGKWLWLAEERAVLIYGSQRGRPASRTIGPHSHQEVLFQVQCVPRLLPRPVQHY